MKRTGWKKYPRRDGRSFSSKQLATLHTVHPVYRFPFHLHLCPLTSISSFFFFVFYLLNTRTFAIHYSYKWIAGIKFEATHFGKKPGSSTRYPTAWNLTSRSRGLHGIPRRSGLVVENLCHTGKEYKASPVRESKWFSRKKERAQITLGSFSEKEFVYTPVPMKTPRFELRIIEEAIRINIRCVPFGMINPAQKTFNRKCSTRGFPVTCKLRDTQPRWKAGVEQDALLIFPPALRTITGLFISRRDTFIRNLVPGLFRIAQ